MKYELFRALHDETDKGWVWLVKDGFHTGDIVKLCREGDVRRDLYCVYREVDANFLTRYNERQHTKKIAREKVYKRGEQMAISDRDKYKDVIVISQWYRIALGIGDQEAYGNIDVRKPWCAHWGHLRAACHHPDPFVRLGTRLGVLGVWLGIVALLPVMLAIAGRICPWVGIHPNCVLLIFAIVTAIVGLGACWSVKR